MEMIFMWVLLSICCCVSSATQVYYITPNHSNCSVENETLKPCYTLSQLIMEDILSSSKDNSIEVVFLPGTHLATKSQTFIVSNFSKVVIRPFTEQQVVVMECQHKAGRNRENSNLSFQDITKLSLLSLHFTSCFITFGYKTSGGGPREVNITKCVFEGSKRNFAVSILYGASTGSKLNATILNCTFTSNHKGAMEISNTDGVVQLQIADTLFQNNGEDFYSVTLYTSSTELTIQNSQFIENTAGNIGAVYGASLVLHGTQFHKNNALNGVLYLVPLYRSSIDVHNCQFVNNSGSAAIVLLGTSSVPRGSQISYCLFKGNDNRNRNANINAKYQNKGGAIYIYGNSQLTILLCHFQNNSATYGGALYLEDGNAYVKIQGSSFTFNKAKDGGAIYCDNFESVSLFGYIASSNSAVSNGGFVYLSPGSELRITFDFNIANNTASNGGAVYAIEGRLIVYNFLRRDLQKPGITVDYNYASKCGGAFYLINSYIDIYTPLLFKQNAAVKKGGAIFILDQMCGDVPDNFQCFFSSSLSRQTLFTNNTAPEGPVLYGGLLDRCRTQQLLGIDYFKSIAEHDPAPLAITSEPARVCLCNDDQVNCSIREITLHGVKKGQSIHLVGTVVDQFSNPLKSYVKASFVSAQLDKGESMTRIDDKCSNLSYHVFTTSTSATLTLRPEGYCEYANFSELIIHITVQPCPSGFESNDDRCGCDRRLAEFSITVCNIDTYSIQRQMHVWIRYDQKYLKVHANCPLDYCNATLDTISLEFPDEQCANHRSGVLCGACQDNYSIALGGSKCLQCTSNYTVIWLIPVFALAGIALVALLFVCNMTISHGTLNGLIFYANVVSITGLTSLQNCSVNPILTVFIAWVNLDLGIEACFYSGMDTYQKTWLQFAFPLYIWLLVGAVILASQCSMTVVKLFGRSSIAVLATLFLLSYSKILSTIITALNFTEIFQGNANETSDPLMPYNVWAYDGNLEYLKGKHMPLFAVAVVMLVALFLPYTLLLTFGQCLRSLPTERRCVPRLIRRTAFISIMDAYHAPYNKKHRYWTGLLLMTRCVLYLAFATSYTDNQLLSNMYITTIVHMVILTLNFLKVYTNSLKNLLEICFLLNLGILSATLHYLQGNNSRDSSICKCTNASVSISMVLFGSITIYHAYLQLKKTRFFPSLLDRFHDQWCTKQYNALREEECAPQPTSMTVQLREDLLESY